MFSSRKVAQMAAYFIEENGRIINILKLMKLLYLSDRESFEKYGAPISFDKFVSMDNGPVLSQTLNLIDGFVPSDKAASWDEWISDRDNHDVSLKKSFDSSDLDELSDSELEILRTIWNQFGWMDQWQLVEYTHNHCPEWQNPHGSSTPISDDAILSALGMSEEDVQTCVEEMHSQREISRLLEQL